MPARCKPSSLTGQEGPPASLVRKQQLWRKRACDGLPYASPPASLVRRGLQPHWSGGISCGESAHITGRPSTGVSSLASQGTWWRTTGSNTRGWYRCRGRPCTAWMLRRAPDKCIAGSSSCPRAGAGTQALPRQAAAAALARPITQCSPGIIRIPQQVGEG
jgi:hypothetical protein